MAYIDIFNGDADGICALTQIRNANPVQSQLVTGVKRDIQLVEKAFHHYQVKAGDQLTILDISLDKNRDGVEKALEIGAQVFYADHHFAGDIPANSNLTAIIDTASDVCTSILVNHHLQGEYLAWAVVGAFGDNLKKSAVALAKPLSLSQHQLDTLENLGIYMNYNGYGSSLEDLHFAPAELFRLVSVFADPFKFIAEAPDTFGRLETGYHEDMQRAAAINPYHASSTSTVYILPDASWARRVSGVYSNDLANAAPARAHAVLTERKQGDYVVSVRAPLEDKTGADELCRRFPTGGGRKAAAGINQLPAASVDDFIAQFAEFYATR